MALLPVADALARVLDGVTPLSTEDVGLIDADQRILAADIVAKLTQPPFDASAMDGYAVRGADVAQAPVTLALIGESHAGRGFAGKVGAGETVRILTGAPLPSGTDTVVIQENVTREEARVRVNEPAQPGANVRKAGGDFATGDVLLKAGTQIDASAITLAAAAGHASLPVRGRPRVAILATGDELVEPGAALGPDQIVSSNPYGLAALIARAGGEARLLGIAGDTEGAVEAKLAAAQGADILVTIGGASVGDRDLVRPALEAAGMSLDFWKVAIRPGKPMLFGRLGPARVLGLPGNPLSCLIAARVFLVPLICRLAGRSEDATQTHGAALTAELPANGPRQHYLPGLVAVDAHGQARVTPFRAFDSAFLTGLAGADALIIRPPEAPEAPAGTIVQVLPARF